MKLHLSKTILVLLLFPFLNTLNAQDLRVSPPEKIEKKTEAVPDAHMKKKVLHMDGKLSPSQMIELDTIADYMTKNPKCRIQISGHWDNQCTREESEKKSLEIANEVVKYLTQKGISRRRLLDVGNGARMPVSDNGTPEGRKANRRVELVILPK